MNCTLWRSTSTSAPFSASSVHAIVVGHRDFLQTRIVGRTSTLSGLHDGHPHDHGRPARGELLRATPFATHRAKDSHHCAGHYSLELTCGGRLCAAAAHARRASRREIPREAEFCSVQWRRRVPLKTGTPHWRERRENGFAGMAFGARGSGRLVSQIRNIRATKVEKSGHLARHTHAVVRGENVDIYSRQSVQNVNIYSAWDAQNVNIYSRRTGVNVDIYSRRGPCGGCCA